jgi:cysteine-rich repeat protein
MVAMGRPRFSAPAALGVVALSLAASVTHAQQSVARQWNEELLAAIRNDLARPTIHARNLYHVSAAMWDAWAAFGDTADQVFHRERAAATDVDGARAEAISYAAYRVLTARFANSPGAARSQAAFDARMVSLRYSRNVTSTEGTSAAALGNRIAATVLASGAVDGANEAGNYASLHYASVNEPLIPTMPGNPTIGDPNRWQPIALDFFVDQSGHVIPRGSLSFLSPEWGAVTPFSLTAADRTTHRRDGVDWVVYHDPGPPPQLGTDRADEYKATFEHVLLWSGLLDPTDGTMIDISPASRGDNTLGTNDGDGYELNPRTGQPYTPEIVPAGDYYRVLAEFWADGPHSETPPGHWFTIANYVSDHPALVKRIGGTGPVVDDLEWDVKVYLALGGAMHDVAVAAWGVKGWYDYIRPVSALRYLADRGQASDPAGLSYHPDGIRLYPGRIEVVTAESSAPGQRHAHLAGSIGKIAARAWRGPDFVADPDTDTAGVGWILVENWWPYQRPSFVTPPFAGYVSGHSTYSRAAAEVVARVTGDPFFPGGVGVFVAPRNEFLVFEDGPSVTVTLQWATYGDAADECSLSRIYGGIHPPADDIPGRFMGAAIGPQAFERARSYFEGTVHPQLCGNGLLDAGEACDDGNAVGGDCCSAACLLDAAGTVCDDGDSASAVDECRGGTCVSIFATLLGAPCGAEALPSAIAALIDERVSKSEEVLARFKAAVARGQARKAITLRARAARRLGAVMRSEKLARARRRGELSGACAEAIMALVADRQAVVSALPF